MKFGLKQMFERTPPKLVIIGQTLQLLAAEAVNLSVTTQYHSLAAGISMASIFGSMLTSLFGENGNGKKKK